MSKKTCCLIFSLFFALTAACLAQDLYINNQKAEEGQTINLFYDDLDAGKINFSVQTDKMKKAEVTLDKGRSWQEMNKERDRFSYSYRPLSDEVISPELILTSEDGSLRTIRPNTTVRYQKKKPDQAVNQLFEKMKTYYENEDISNFMNLFSMSYPDRVKFIEAIQNDFYNYRNLRLFYRVDQRIFDDDYEGAVCSVYWQRKGDNRTGTSFSDNAIITTRLDKEGAFWLISGFRNNTLFGSSLIPATATSTAQPDLSISTSNITLTNQANGSPIAITISTGVNNIGTAAANNVKIKYYKKITASTCGGVDADFVEIGTNQISSIGASSSGTAANVVYTQAPACYGTTTVTIKVVVNYDSSIVESDASNDTNNSATNSITSTYVP